MYQFRELSSVPPLDGEVFYQFPIGFIPCQITLFKFIRNLIGKNSGQECTGSATVAQEPLEDTAH